MKIEFNSDKDLPQNKTIEITNKTIAVRALFHESNKYCLQFSLDEYLYKYRYQYLLLSDKT